MTKEAQNEIIVASKKIGIISGWLVSRPANNALDWLDANNNNAAACRAVIKLYINFWSADVTWRINQNKFHNNGTPTLGTKRGRDWCRLDRTNLQKSPIFNSFYVPKLH